MLAAPTWLVDVARLRVTLDDLRAALTRPAISIPPTPSALGYDFDRLTGSLLAVLEGLAGIDVDARRAVSGMTSMIGDAAQLARLRSMVDELHASWIRFVTGRIGESKAAIAGAFVRRPGLDLLGILRRGTDENAHSDVIRWLLDPAEAPTLAPFALHRLVDRLGLGPSWHASLDAGIASGTLTVRREVVLGRATGERDNLLRLDVVVFGPDVVIGIENKILAVEHAYQTELYWEWLCELPGRHAGVFLTPTGDPPKCPQFVALSYLDLLDCLLEASARGAELRPTERKTLHAYILTLARHVLQTELRCLKGDTGP